MKFFINYYNIYSNKPYNKFLINLFFLKNSLFFKYKNLLYIYIFTNIKRKFNVNLIKFNELFFNNIIIYFIIINISIQFLFFIYSV